MTTVNTTDFQDAATNSRKVVTFAVLLALFLAAMDSTVIGTLLPVLKVEFGQPQWYPWLLSGFIFTSVLATPMMGLLADRLGEKNIMLASLMLFIAGSVWVAVVHTMGGLIAARVFQGIGAGGIMVLAYIMVGKLYSEQERGKMQGLLSAVWGLAAISGPLLGSVLHEYLSWRLAFWLNLPLGGLFFLVLAAKYPQAKIERVGASFDALGFIFFAIFTSALLLLIMMPVLNIAQSIQIGLIVAIVVAGIALARLMSAKRQSSFLAFEFFSSRLSLAAFAIVLAGIVMYAAITLLPQFLVDITQRSVLSAGFVVLTASLGWTVGATVCGAKLQSLGYRIATLTGFILLTAGSSLLWLANEQNPLWWFLLAEICIGLGIGYVATATLILAQNKAGNVRMGVMTSAVQLFRNLGAAIGVNSIAALQMWFVQQDGMTDVDSFQNSFLLLVILSGIGLVVSIGIPKQHS